MKNKFTPKKVFLITYLVYAIFTGGLTFYSTKGFGDPQQLSINSDLRCELEVNNNDKFLGIPFVGFFNYSPFPQSLRFRAWDESNKYSRVTLIEATIIYEGDKTDQISLSLDKKFSDCNKSIGSTEEIVHTPMMFLSGSTPKIINREQSFQITLKGYLLTKDNKKVAFETHSNFVYESSFEIFPFYSLIAAV